MPLNFPSSPGIGQTYGFSNRLWTWNGDAWDLTPREIPQGPQGVQGVQGLQGYQGLQGLQGTQGLQGIGEQGVQGLQGLQGHQGTQGLQGVGEQGVQGLQGLQGVGSQGLQGNQGLSGDGSQGSQGAQGTQGRQGLQGVGFQGVQGSSAGGGGSSVNVLDDTSTNATYYVGYSTATSGVTTSFGISSTKLQFNPSSGTLSATVFTSLSDESQKTNIRPIENALNLVKQMNGVKYDWKDGHNQSSVGVIAQEVERVLPEVVITNDRGLKTVSYGNIVGVLIEAIKEQQIHIEELERKLNA